MYARESTQTVTGVWPAFKALDASALIDWLIETLGFVENSSHVDDEGRVAHAQLDWSAGGGIMLGDLRPENETWERQPGVNGIYLVSDDVDGLYARAKAAGATIRRELTDQDYGSREFTVEDPEGNLWSIGTYAGEPRKG